MMSKVKEILQQYTEGVGKKEINRRTGVPRNTLKRYIRLFIAMGKSLEEILCLPDSDLEMIFNHRQEPVPSQRQSDLYGFFPYMAKALKRKGTTMQMLHKEYLEKYSEGFRYTQFTVYYRRWGRRNDATMHMLHKAGDKMYVDYAGDRLEFIEPSTGEILKAEVFVAILGASQLTYVEAGMSQKKEDFVGSCENALYYFRGAPQAIVTDNLKSAVVKSNRYEPTLNETFRDFTEHYRMTALPAGPYKPKHKALVEGAVKIIYRTIYAKVREREHHGLQALNEAIREALEQHNAAPMKGRPYSRRQLFEETEAHALQPLNALRYAIKSKCLATVARNNHVCLAEDKHYYSVPYYYIGKKTVILYSTDQVDIYYRYERIATHYRDRRPYQYTTVTDHLASCHQFLTDWTPEKFLQRALAVGEETGQYILEILNRRQHPEQSYKTCQGILSYAPKVGHDRLNAACRRASHFGDFSYKTIVTILENGLDQEAFDLDASHDEKPLPPHDNIRGKEYYA